MKLRYIKTVLIVAIWGGAMIAMTINKEIGMEALKIASIATVAFILIS